MNHHIRKLTVDLRLPPASDAFAIQQQISQFCRRAIEPTLEPVFDEFSAGKSIQIDRLEVDLGAIQLNTSQWEDLLTTALRTALHQRLQEWLATAPAERVQSPTDQLFTQWLHFLQTGRLPWSATALPTNWQTDVLAILASRQGAVQQMQQQLKRHPQALTRLIQQHPPVFLKQVIDCATARPQQALLTSLDELIRLVQDVGIGQLVWLELAERKSVTPFMADLKRGISTRRLELYFWTTVLNEAVVTANQRSATELLQQTWQVLFGELPKLTSSIKRRKRQFPVLSRALSELVQGTAIPGSELRQGEISAVASPAPPADQLAKPITQNDAATPTDSQLVSLHKPPTEVSDRQDERMTSPQSGREQSTDETSVPKQEASASLPESNAQAGMDALLKPTDPGRTDDLPDMSPELAEGVFLTNAGIVLLHPFLEPLFRRVGLLDGFQFKSEAAQQKAILLLHYAATGQTNTLEYNLLLAKVLCGWPLPEPLDHTLSLDQTQTNEVDELLHAAIEHWGALGNVSPDALREGFLQRPGKLRRMQGTWWLHVETETLDILLDQLPYTWGFNHIMLPWMPELLRVEWR